MPLETEIPEDTILDLDPPFPLITDQHKKALLLMKALYLNFPLLQRCRQDCGWTATELVNAAETLRRRGHIKLVEQPDGAIQLRITPTGDIEVFLHEIGAQ